MKILTNKSLIIKKNCKNFINGIIDTILLKKFSKKNFSKLFFLGLLIAMIICSFDLISKKLIFNYIDQYHQVNSLSQIDYNEVKIFSFFSLVKVYNTGISFGMFNKINNSNVIFTVIQGGIAIALLFWLYQVKNLYLTIALGLVKS
jgi:lipoprotein signal peptidase